MELYDVKNTELADLPAIYRFFDESVSYQQRNGYPVWKNYDKQAIVKDIEAGHQYKVIIATKPAIVFSICYQDKVIWRKMDQGDSLYLHRIVVNPDFKGQKLFGLILNWAIAHARHRDLKNIRMDTWAINTTIRAYYETLDLLL